MPLMGTHGDKELIKSLQPLFVTLPLIFQVTAVPTGGFGHPDGTPQKELDLLSHKADLYIPMCTNGGGCMHGWVQGVGTRASAWAQTAKGAWKIPGKVCWREVFLVWLHRPDQEYAAGISKNYSDHFPLDT